MRIGCGSSEENCEAFQCVKNQNKSSFLVQSRSIYLKLPIFARRFLDFKNVADYEWFELDLVWKGFFAYYYFKIGIWTEKKGNNFMAKTGLVIYKGGLIFVA